MNQKQINDFAPTHEKLLKDPDLMLRLKSKIRNDIRRYPEDPSLVRILSFLETDRLAALDSDGSDVCWIIGSVVRLERGTEN